MDKRLPWEELEFRYLDYEEKFAIKDMSADSIWKLAERMAEDEVLHKDYLVSKLGYDIDIPEEV